jgi:nucleotide-binding universal stress UspA family protein
MSAQQPVRPPGQGTGTGRRLVFADDGSSTSDTVWRWIDQHDWPGWTISVVSADDAPDVTVLPPDRVPLVPWAPPQPRLLQPRHGGLSRVEHLVGRADPRVVIDSSGPSSLVVVGPRRHGVLTRLGVGSTVEWLLGSPDPPLAIIRHGNRTRRVLAYVDGTPDAQRAVACVAELPWLSTCEVALLAPRGEGRFGEGVEQAAATLRGSGVEPAVQRVLAPAWLGAGELARVVLKEILAIEPDLLVMGLGAHASLRRAFRASGGTEHTLSMVVAKAPAVE